MASAANDREKALDAALAQIERQFGKGSVMRLGEDGRAPVEVIPTGSIALDVALGIGGLPRGRIVEIYATAAGELVRSATGGRPTDADVRLGATITRLLADAQAQLNRPSST